MKFIGPLQVVIFVAIILFIFFAIDLYKRKRITIIHIFFFLGGISMIGLFTWDVNLLNMFGAYFGLQRGADLLVYFSIIILFYLYFGSLNQNIKLQIEQTNILRYIAIDKRIGSLHPNTNIALIIPCYKNHASYDFIKNILDEGYGIVFIDDGYNSHELLHSLKKLINQGSNLVIISHPHNMGQGAALQTGQDYIYNYTTIPYIVHFDSDGQHDINDIPTFLAAFQKNPSLDIVLGSRFLSENDIPAWRKFNKKLQIIFSKFLTGLHLTDTHNGLRMMKYTTLPKLTITLNDYSHASEIETLIKSHKLTWQEVPMHVIYEDRHLTGGQPLSNAFSIAKKILYRLLFFR